VHAPAVSVKDYPVWWDTAPDLRVAGAASDPGGRTFDVAVIGAGYTGLAAACQMARAGAAVVVVERGHVGEGASSRNGGQVLTGLKLDPATLVARYGQNLARDLFGISRDAIARLAAIVAEQRIECGFERVGHLQAAWKPAHFAAFREEQSLLERVFDHHVTLVEPRDQATELGTTRYCGLLVDEASAAINPARYVEGLAAAARRLGVEIVTGREVTRLDRRDGGWRILTGGSHVDAGDVLLATNGYVSGLSSALQRRLVPIGSYIIATEPLPEAVASALVPRRRVVFDSKHLLFYFRLTPDRRLVFGGRAEFSQPSPDAVHRAVAILRRGMVGVFPQLAEARIDYGWGGLVAVTRDQMPHAGRFDGVYVAGGYCGHGIAMATHVGELIARRIAGEVFEHPLLDAPFPPVPFYRGTPWFLPLVGAYYEVRDWLG
jgi:glycine/D-amino acid oxidase-like deaminating enzyme